MFVQIVDDSSGHTLASASTFKLTDGDKTATRRKAAGSASASPSAPRPPASTKVVFDRGGNTYPGRVAAFADAAREGGLEF